MTAAIRLLATLPLVVLLGACATAGNEKLQQHTPRAATTWRRRNWW